MSDDSKNKKRFSFSDVSKKLDDIMDKNSIDKSNSRFSISDICEYLKINEKEQEQIKAMPFTKIKAYYEEMIEEIKIIPLAELQGVNLRELTQNAWNWFSQLENLRFVKIKNYSRSFEEMYKFLNEDSLLQADDLPIVIKYNNKYFIEEGLHRLTIAKCIGIREFKVVVKFPKTTEVKILNEIK
jgi:hypothetical protein